MARELFVDSSGFFALLANRDAKHKIADRVMQRAGAEKRRLVTTDYVLDETATLLKVRGQGRLAGELFERVFRSAVYRLEWTEEARFAQVRAFFLKHADQAWSFTDCVSFCVMKELRLTEALTSDQHFEQAGFVALLS